jgi:hypothetical protein
VILTLFAKAAKNVAPAVFGDGFTGKRVWYYAPRCSIPEGYSLMIKMWATRHSAFRSIGFEPQGDQAVGDENAYQHSREPQR